MAPPASASSPPAAAAPSAPTPDGPAPAAPAPAGSAKPGVPSLFSAKDGEDVGDANPFLGDVDGDGFDDFFIMAMLPGVFDEFAPPIANGAHIYLFYGRADFPTRLTTADADAVFDAMLTGSGPLGDINGDGYADFAIQRFGSIEFVFGSPQRLRGKLAEGSAGVRWIAPPVAPELGPGFPTDLFINALGDYNGDGCAEIAIFAPRGAARDPFLQGSDGWFYVVSGRRGSWPSGMWDAKWASAHFAAEEIEADVQNGNPAYSSPLAPTRAGDLDADGFDDLIVAGSKNAFVMYGGRRPLTGEISAAQADATLVSEAQFLWPVSIGDADGDGGADILITGAVSTAIEVMYGRRWSGNVNLQADLSIFVAGVFSREIAAATGDIDGDGSPEIVIAASNAGQDVASERPGPPRGALYVVRGTGKRLLGEVHLTDSNLLLLGPKAGARDPKSPFDGGIGWTLSMTGDVDGDGGLDILTSSPNAITSSQSLGGVFLVPSTPKTPL